MKTNELSGVALDWAVAKCEGEDVQYIDDGITQCLLRASSGRYSPSTDWAQGGAIIEREKIGMWFCDEVVDAETDEVVRGAAWYAETFEGEHGVTGQTALIAAMRCYVASKLGDDVNLPEGLQ
jgi:hypothetical protein